MLGFLCIAGAIYLFKSPVVGSVAGKTVEVAKKFGAPRRFTAND
jgi:hypothetical protein